MEALALIASMHAHSQQMLDAARANDWDRLSALEKQRSALRRGWPANPSAAYEALSAADRARAEALIRQTIDLDAMTRSIVEPWLESTRQLFARGARQRDLRSSYGAFRQAP